MGAHGELEHVILGLVAKFGPLTAYAVRRHFATSPTPAFSSGAGTIYPAIARLVRARLLRARADARGAQTRALLTITAAGRRRHQAWLFDPAGDFLRPSPDPLRTRIYFLGLLPAREQRAFLARALRTLEAQVSELERYAASYPPEGATLYSNLASEGITELARARLRWLKSVRDTLARR
jgi:DNA-binding PadR family transcriptional regulator